jgi:hypothetical protein
MSTSRRDRKPTIQAFESVPRSQRNRPQPQKQPSSSVELNSWTGMHILIVNSLAIRESTRHSYMQGGLLIATRVANGHSVALCLATLAQLSCYCHSSIFS